ncbi:hypothetical protein [Paracoccus marinaquae]|uniref:Uncharacterized protein n=1 Tax=Paracoccus marinaquae TaxID=2841926 RepID=A0ABS6AGD7_9RHOB|nr:hypothetical protein [Paracoccus marinaquae]MBU3029657.1 hypothetical protein [Paracoccus marinaquae]
MREIGMVIRERAKLDHGATLPQAASCFHGPEADGTAPTAERGEVLLASIEFDRRQLAATTLDGRIGHYSVIKRSCRDIVGAPFCDLRLRSRFLIC